MPLVPCHLDLPISSYGLWLKVHFCWLLNLTYNMEIDNFFMRAFPFSWRLAKRLDSDKGRTRYFRSSILCQWEEGFGTYPPTSGRGDSQHLHHAKKNAQRLFTLRSFIIFCPWGIYVLTNFFLLIWRVFFLFVTNLNFWILECITWITYHSSYA